jgi:selenophosphate synthetase-related protein
MPGASELDEVARRFRDNAALRAKASIGVVSEVLGPTDWLTGPGDDAAALPSPGDGYLLAAGEAMWPPFVEADPFGAGVGAVVANVNDVAAMGGRPVGLVDTIVGPESVARAVLEGMHHASGLYGVPVVGGHLTVRDGPAAVSAFVLGRAEVPLASRNAAPGSDLLVTVALDGRMHERFPYFSALSSRADALAGDLELLPRAAERGWCLAAKDVSMAGVLGSLAMLLEASGSGVRMDLDRLPRPAGVSLPAWTEVFPSFGFLLCAVPAHADACIASFRDRGLACERVGVLDATGELRVRSGGQERTLLDLRHQAVTGLGRSS